MLAEHVVVHASSCALPCFLIGLIKLYPRINSDAEPLLFLAMYLI